MSLLEGVEKILAAIPAMGAESVRLDQKHGIGPETGLRLGDVQTAMRLLEINREEEKLKACLGTIQYEALLKLAALMSFGRDRDAGFSEKVDALRRRKVARSDMVRTILETVPSCGRYLTDAVERLREEGVDVHVL
jgi:hypothetical protein